MQSLVRAFLMIIIFPSVAFSQTAQSEDSLRTIQLDQIIGAIHASNPDIQASRLSADAMATKGRQVSALPDPMVMFTVQPYPIYTARGTQRAQFRVEQAFPFPGKLGLKEEIADLGATIGTYETEALEDNLILQAKLAYFELYRIQRHERLIHEFEAKLRDFESIAVVQYEVGRGMQQAIVKAQLERNTLSKRLLDLSWQRRSAGESLARLIDRPVSVVNAPLIEVEIPSWPAMDEDRLLAIALRNRPEANALDTSTKRADASVNLARKNFLPDFSVNVTYFDLAESDMPPSADGKNALALGVSVKVPLQRGRLKAALQEARLQRTRVDSNVESLETSFRTRIVDMLSRVREDEKHLDLYRETLIPQAETTLEATLSAYTTGRTDFLNLLDAERVLFTIHTGFEDIFARYLMTVAMLERELGVTSISELSDR